ncbi:hypothetical protein T12_4008 [Trichinella patagoniensis]|uniref:Uncharacterized protein n=1 Tax=Trichinella patagoniensis TaxID=990121 RepID=A0A0V0ZZP0_9BILA|nr:hypothetical protein T12_4008 [Trichinella patagoniensis]
MQSRPASCLQHHKHQFEKCEQFEFYAKKKKHIPISPPSCSALFVLSKKSTAYSIADNLQRCRHVVSDKLSAFRHQNSERSVMLLS